jgi:hypothetical protein
MKTSTSSQKMTYMEEDFYPSQMLIKRVLDKISIWKINEQLQVEINDNLTEDINYIFSTVYILKRLKALINIRLSTEQFKTLTEDIINNSELITEIEKATDNLPDHIVVIKESIRILGITREEVSMIRILADRPAEKLSIYKKLLTENNQ